ncbi:MAG: hypothetical protein AAGC85_27120 [Bacteroidota bacterium]
MSLANGNNGNSFDHIRRLVVQNSIEEALEILINSFSDLPKVDELLVQASRFNGLMKEVADGTLSNREKNEELNKLRTNILAFLRNAENNLSSQVPSQPPEKGLRGYREVYLQSSIRLKVIDQLKVDFPKGSGYTVKELVANLGLGKRDRKYIVQVLLEMEGNNLVDKTRLGERTRWKLNQDGLNFFK